MDTYKTNPQAGTVLIFDPYWTYMVITSHNYTPELSNNPARVISLIFPPTWPALQDREQKI